MNAIIPSIVRLRYASFTTLMLGLITTSPVLALDLNLGYLTIDATGTGEMSLSQTQDSLRVNTEYLGYSSNGVFSQSNGTHTVTFMYFGQASTGHGVYNLTGGTLNAAVEIIGRSGSGLFTQSGGLNSSTNNFTLGSNSSSYGSYELSNTGRLETWIATIGSFGSGSFTQNSGTHIVDQYLNLGSHGGGNGSYALSGTSSLTIGKGLTIGNSGTGSFVQNAGSVNIGDYISLGSSAGSSGSYHLSAGSLITDRAIIGGTGIGNFVQSGGTHTVNSDLTMGASFFYNGYIPKYYIGDGTYTLTGGTLTVNGSILNSIGKSTLNIDGGKLNAGNVDVDTLNVGSSFNSSGNHTLASGENINATAENIGNQGAGTFTQSGGTHTVGALTLAAQSGASGTYNLQGGSLTAGTIDADNVGADFNFTGGTLAVDTFIGHLVNDGGTLAPGNSPGVTTLEGDYSQGVDGTLLIEIGGLISGSEFDLLNITGSADLAGTLAVELYDLEGDGNPFKASLGDSFEILSAESITGEFDIFTLALLSDGLGWDVNYILNDFGKDFVQLNVVSAVPLPPAVWLFGSAFLGLVGLGRRKTRR